jgi:transketolase
MEAWKCAMQNKGPTAIALSRQNLPVLNRATLAPAGGVGRGGYVLWEASETPEAILIGTGSEVHIALEAGKMLQANGLSTRVVSLPSWELFDAQSLEYRNMILPPQLRIRVSIEAASPIGWEKYVGLDGIAIGVPHFGTSAPAGDIYQKFGLTVEYMVEEVNNLLSKR